MHIYLYNESMHSLRIRIPDASHVTVVQTPVCTETKYLIWFIACMFKLKFGKKWAVSYSTNKEPHNVHIPVPA